MDQRLAPRRRLDNHLTIQIFTPGDTETLLEVTPCPNLLGNLSALDKVLYSDGWQTLMTFTKEMGCK